jgi:hypothetical protein
MTSVSIVSATAFGLDIEAHTPLTFLQGASAMPTGRKLALSRHPTEAASSSWPRDAHIICDERLPDNSVNFRIEAHPNTGYLIWGPEYGAHLLSADASHLRCFPEGQADTAWQRLLIAQVLPFAALLHGLEVLHASAVVRREGVLALLGPSRMGKTSLALELCRRGARFMADDVLALESRDGRLLAHPGSPIAGVDKTDAAGARGEVERVLATNVRERIVAMRGATEPAALHTLLFLERSVDGPEQPRFQSVTDALRLLAATFNFVLATPERLRGLLDVCAMAAQLRVEAVSIGPATSTAALADAVELRLSKQ